MSKADVSGTVLPSERPYEQQSILRITSIVLQERIILIMRSRCQFKSASVKLT